MHYLWKIQHTQNIIFKESEQHIAHHTKQDNEVSHQVFEFFILSSLKKSSKTVLLHLGHFGFSSGMMTYIKHAGQPRSIIVFSENSLSSGLGSRDTQELVGDDILSIKGCALWDVTLGDDDMFSVKSRFGCLISLCFNNLNTSPYIYW